MNALLASLLLVCALIAGARGDVEEIAAIGSTGHFFDNEFHVIGGSDGYDWFPSHLTFFPDGDSSSADNWTYAPEEHVDLARKRSFHSAAIYRGSLFVVGGDSEGIEVRSLQTGKQTYYDIAGPEVRFGQAVVQYDDALYLFGGRHSEGQYLNDLWVADLTSGHVSWTKLQENGESPVPARAFHSAVVYQDSIYIFGGETEDGFANDIWRYDIIRGWWVRCVTNQYAGALPEPRGGHAAVYWIDEGLYIWGGYNDESGYLDDMWRFDFQTEYWSEINQGKLIPTARSHAAFDVRNDNLVLTGGQISLGNEHRYFWNPWLSFQHLSHQADYAADFWSFSFETFEWTLLGCRLVDDGEVICESDHEPECPNDCNHNGVCLDDGQCVCFSEWKGEDCSINNCETHLGYHVELMDRILIAETLLRLSKRLATLKETLEYIDEHLPEWDELTSCLRVGDRPGELVAYIEAAASLNSWYEDGIQFMGGLLFHQEGMQAELIPTLEEFNLVLEFGLENHDYDNEDEYELGGYDNPW